MGVGITNTVPGGSNTLSGLIQKQGNTRCLINHPIIVLLIKSDGKAYTTDLKNTDIFAHFGKNGVRVVSMTGKDKVLWHEWSRTMLETLPPYPGEIY